MKKIKHKLIRRSILIPLLLQVFIFTDLYWGLMWFIDKYKNGFVIDSLYNALGGNLYYSIFFHGRETIIVCAMIIYVLISLIFCIRAILKAIKYVDIISGSIDTLLDNNSEIPEFPAYLKDVEVSIKDIKHNIYRNEQLAREAEQRKNDLVVYLAHDLKTPLTSVIGYISLLQEAPELPMKQRAKYTEIALNKAYRLEQLINEFFDITRFNLQTIELENNRIDLSMMLRQIGDEFYPIFAEKNLTYSENIEPYIKIIGDADKLERVFDNLLRNAISYSYENTCLEVSAKNDNGKAIISFNNIGDEIPEQKLNHIFEKFFRMDNARRSETGGAGLGLAIAKQIVEMHGGTISAASNSQFTEFVIVLPTRM